MATDKLTELRCKTAKPKEKAYKLSDGGGMYLKIMPNGSKLWHLKYRMHGREKTFSLGIYPETTLETARKARDAARVLLKEGTDPLFVKKEKKRLAKISADNTFETIAREWHEHSKARWSEKHEQNILHRLEINIFPIIGNLPIASLKPPQILDVVREIEKRGAHEVARRTLQYSSQVFRYAIQTGRIESDPTRDLKGALKPFRKGHYAALDAKDLPEFVKSLQRNEARLYPQTRRAMQLLMFTFVRTSELIKARWDEFDLENGEWIVPAERMKMGKAHIVPLCRQSIVLLKEQKELTGKWEWVFPNQAHPKTHMSNNTILGALKRLGYKGQMTGHGFRALAMSTIKEKLDYRHEVIDRQLAHSHKNSVDAAYDRAQFLSERQKMMQEWADYIDVVADGGNVVVGSFKKRA